MVIGSVENVVRYFALAALILVAMLGGLFFFGVLKMPEYQVHAVQPTPWAQAATPRPRTPAPIPEARTAPASAAPMISDDQAAGEGTFQSDSAAGTPAPAAIVKQGGQ